MARKRLILSLIFVSDKMAACAAVGGFRKNVQKWTQLQCEIECCTEDNCNTHIPSLEKGEASNSIKRSIFVF